MVIAFLAVRGIRNSRTGRVLIALRDNEGATEAYGVNPVRAKLTAFAISGFLAATAGAIITHHQQSVIVNDAGFGIGVFTASVVGGLGSATGAFIGSLYWNGTFFWLKGSWRLLASGIGTLIVLLIAPGGLAGLWYDLRDLALRTYGKSRGIVEADIAEDLLGATDSPDDAVGGHNTASDETNNSTIDGLASARTTTDESPPSSKHAEGEEVPVS
jgi:branched-chain amino acid transport system permease protein